MFRMNIKPLKVTVREVVDGYVDDSDREEGIYGYGGRLNIRPKYQRNYIYDDAKRNAVIDTVSKDFPLGIMYWVKNEDGSYEILDGQQRTISLCTFVSIDDPARGYSIPGLFGNPHARTFSQLLPKEKKRILDYQLLVYVCEGADTDRLRWRVPLFCLRCPRLNLARCMCITRRFLGALTDRLALSARMDSGVFRICLSPTEFRAA